MHFSRPGVFGKTLLQITSLDVLPIVNAWAMLLTLLLLRQKRTIKLFYDVDPFAAKAKMVLLC
jgi:hypothetical protein